MACRLDGAKSLYDPCCDIDNWTFRIKLREILIGLLTSSFRKMHFNMSSVKWRPFRLGLSVWTCPGANSLLCFVTLSSSMNLLQTELFRWKWTINYNAIMLKRPCQINHVMCTIIYMQLKFQRIIIRRWQFSIGPASDVLENTFHKKLLIIRLCNTIKAIIPYEVIRWIYQELKRKCSCE